VIGGSPELGVVGRQRELAAMEDVLATGETGLRILVVEGEAGIGKTTVWQAAIGQARARGVPVLSCQAVEAEAPLAFASLADLIAPIVDDGLAGLPEPQRLALEVALLRAAPEAPPDRRAI